LISHLFSKFIKVELEIEEMVDILRHCITKGCCICYNLDVPVLGFQSSNIASSNINSSDFRSSSVQRFLNGIV